MTCATPYKQLLSARSQNYIASSLKRRRQAFCIGIATGTSEGGYNNINSFRRAVGASAIASGRHRHSNSVNSSSPWHRTLSINPSACISTAQSRSRCMSISTHQIQEQDLGSSHPSTSTLANLEFRVNELDNDNAPQLQRMTKHDFQNQVWPLLVDCASISSFAHNHNSTGYNNMSMQQERFQRAKLCSRLLELCLKSVEARRVFLWEWLQALDENTNTTNNNDDDRDGDNNVARFSPTAYWNETARPPKEMFTLVLNAWKSVIESCSSFSVKSVDAMELMESSAQQASSVLSLMEDEHSSDVAFVHAYNSQVDTGKYTELVPGAAPPDVRNYSEAIGTWGQCIDGSVLRLPERRGGGGGRGSPRDGGLQKRLQLEATAMKSMMKMLESMEEDLYEPFGEPTMPESSQRKKPPPDRVCYNIILTSMARQANPSLHEMRLVLQRMMERVKFELEYNAVNEEYLEDDDTEVDHFHEYAMTFFPDIFSYNALIEARANRSAMFASNLNSKQQDQQQQFTSPRLPHHAAWQQGQTTNNLQQGNSRFSSSEEEALLAEQIVEEMLHISTASVRPNIWSYNALIKAWIKSDSERGLQRAVMILHSLALNGHNRMEQHYEVDKDTLPKTMSGEKTDDVLSVFGRIAQWGTSLLGKSDAKHNEGKNAGHAVKSRRNTEANQWYREGKDPTSNSKAPNQSQHPSANIGIASRLNYVYSGTQELSQGNSRGPPNGRHSSRQNSAPRISQSSFGMSGRMALMNSVFQGNSQGRDPRSKVKSARGNEIENRQLDRSEPIGPLPYIEPNVHPDLKTFGLIIQALERRGSASSAKLAEDLLHLLGEYYFDLNPDITIYNSALNAWAKAAKVSSNVESCFASAQRADKLLCTMLGKENDDSGMFPQPNEYSFLMVVNAWANAASSAMSARKSSDGKIAAEHAEELLKKLHKQTSRTNKAKVACYGAVIRTWASLGHAERAQAILEEMAESSGSVPLDLIHFNAVLDAWVRQLASAGDPDMVMSRLPRLHDLLIKMDSGRGHQSYNVSPDTSSFNHVIRACYAPFTSKTFGDESNRQKALEIAYDAYTRTSQDYNSSHRPDAHTYSHMLKAIACLLPSTETDLAFDSEKGEFCRTIFRACCRDGHLAKSSLWTLRKMFSTEEEFAELLLSEMGHPANMNKKNLLSISEDQLFAYLPEEWSRNGRKLKALNRHKQ